MSENNKRGKFSKDDFKHIKHMQKLGWKPETIMAKTSWSRRTIDRALQSSTWSVYRGRISRETKKIRDNRALAKAERLNNYPHSNEAGSYMSDGIMHPSSAAGRTPQPRNYTGIVIAVIVLGVTLLIYLLNK